ncbi:expressed unknown protein [Seminavis robusta]|uniref:Uncharacterized protein n=1 Tax=Seminavis robusta TaxID=568900 RepID=A0A9N8D7W3_9STRA|nr:expressed unknown protein [Seminavis robusta]|eukprot:Sro10_g008010.1 n/a (591) ;mRNA; r:77598-79546
MRSINSLFSPSSYSTSTSSSSTEPMAFGRRRRALSAASATKKKAKNSKSLTTATSTMRTPTETPSAAARKKATSTTTTTTPSPPTPIASVLNNTVTTTSCNERLHYVLARKSKEALSALTESLRAHSGVKTVCVYTDSPLVSRAPLSQRQQKIMLTSMSQACTKMTTLQLDFSSEFGPQTEVILDCELLATILQNAEQLESLLLKDVSLKGNVQVLQEVLLNHKHLSKLELKWCTEVNTNNDNTDTACDKILSSLITTLSQMKHLHDLTLLVSSAHNLPLPELAHSNTLKRLTLGLEQRHVSTTPHTTTAQSVLQRHAEQVLLVQFLQALKQNICLEECILFSHHWKSSMTLSCVCELVGSQTSILKNLSMTDYNYGSDDPRKLLELATVLQTNKHLQRFKLITKKRISSAVDKKTRKANTYMIDTAFVETLEHNFTLQNLDIAHAGIHISDAHKNNNSNNNGSTVFHRASTPCKACCSDVVPGCLEQPHKHKYMIPFFLMTNRHDQSRQRFTHSETINWQEWKEFVVKYKDNTQLLFFLIQANPSLLLPALSSWWPNNNNGQNNNNGNAYANTSKNGQLGGRHIWEYYF